MSDLALAERQGVIDYTRQRDWLDPTKLSVANAQVWMIGVGGIGTPTALLLAKMGLPRINLVDFDEVERHNLPNQLFPLDSVGQLKTRSARSMLRSLSPSEINAYEGKVTEDGMEGDMPRLGGIVISALDSMEARVNLWKQVKRNIGVKLFLDARLGGENIVVHAINPMNSEDIARYEETLYTDEDALPDPCTRRSVMDVGFAVASLLGRAVRRHLAGEELDWRVYLNQETLNVFKG